MVEPAMTNDYLSPGLASKLFGLLNFLDSGLFDKVGRAGLGALRDRITEDGVTSITHRLKESL